MHILFVCTGNTCRSAMAQEVARLLIQKMGLEDIEVSSAGVYAQNGMPASLGAQGAVAHLGGELTYHRARQLTPGMLADADLILTMEERHLHMIRSMGNVAHKSDTLIHYATGSDGSIADPFGADEDVYLDSLTQIGDAVRRVLESIGKNGKTDGNS